MKSLIFLLMIIFVSNIYAADNLPKSAIAKETKLKPFEKKSLTGAVILEFFIPTTGFLYAGDWTKSIFPVAFRLSGLIMAYKQLDIGIMGGKTKIVDKFLFTSGIVVWAAAWIWTYTDLKKIVKNYNSSLQISFNSTTTNEKKIMLTLSYSF